ncbi:immunoglobulin-like domain-containing protein [Sporosarcina sp. G11-34]|uniref:immunoglobulin-like domain-containing protein n=1 Tax=Sporosarcina sp. G11-34 TaxID=2849605 RepID=UPI0022A98133|nr:immunoglobulin-like domain-containing protein [Sporosarcina sp. G11-34]MCZ2259642.1 DUF5011 domain-containing protein [Sporosarcina sp. G11-34]
MDNHFKHYNALIFLIIGSLLLFSFSLTASAESITLDQVVIIETKDDFDQGEAARMKGRIGQIHPSIINALYERNLTIKLINFPLTDLPEYEFLRGEIPRGWENTGKTWDDVPGAGGNPAVARIGYSNPSEWHGTINLELHELAHLIDSHVFNYSSHTAEFSTIHKEEQAGFLQGVYFTNTEEYFAESFSYYYLGGERRSKLQLQAPKTYKFISSLPLRLSGGQPESELPKIVDVHAPVITLVGDDTIELTMGQIYNESGATATDAIDGDLSGDIVISNEVNTAKPGQYSVFYSVTDKAGNKATAIRIVIVSEINEDLAAPIITILGDKSTELFVGDTYEELGATAEDDVDGDLSKAILISGEVDTTKPGKYDVTYSVVDNNGNTATANRVVNVLENESQKDISPPVITLDEDTPFELNAGGVYEEMGATAKDAMNRDLSDAIIITGEVDTNKPGQYTKTYSVTDDAGNITTETRTVTVLEPPVSDEDNKDDEDISNEKLKVGGGKAPNISMEDSSEVGTKDNADLDASPLPSSPNYLWLILLIGLSLILSASIILLVRKKV